MLIKLKKLKMGVGIALGVAIGAGLGAACSNSGGDTTSLTERDIEFIRSIPNTYTNGFLENDRSGILGLFSEDAVLIPHHGDPPVIGLELIKEHFWPSDSPPFRVNKFSLDQVETDGSGNLAYTRGTSEIEFSMQIDGVWNTYSNAGNFLMIFRKNPDNNWYIARYIWNDPIALME